MTFLRRTPRSLDPRFRPTICRLLVLVGGDERRSPPPSPRLRGEGRGEGRVVEHEGLSFQALINHETPYRRRAAPHPNPLPASGERGLPGANQLPQLNPASTTNTCLVIIRLSSAARNSAMRAISSASSVRGRHCWATNDLMSSSLNHNLRCRSVTTAPGAMALTRIFSGPNSRYQGRIARAQACGCFLCRHTYCSSRRGFRFKPRKGN